jgi:ABC-type amino acid transport substrate-binding protein
MADQQTVAEPSRPTLLRNKEEPELRVCRQARDERCMARFLRDFCGLTCFRWRKLIAFTTGGEIVLRAVMKGFRYGLFLFCLILSPWWGCVLYMAHEVSGPAPQPKPEPPKPSGTLLEPQLRIGLSPDYMPLAYKDPTFGLVGLEVDFANQLGNGLGKKIVFIETPFPDLIQALLERRIDIIMSGMSITSERTELVSFTDPYARIGQMALVRAKDRSMFPNVQSFSKLTSKIGFVQMTTGEMAAKAFFPQATLAPQPTIDDGIAALRKGEIEVFIHDAPTIWRIAGNPNEKELEGLYWPLTKEPLAWAVRKDDEPLRFALNRELEQWRINGSLKQMLSRWVSLRIW